ncbi:cAMP-regulated phosphoprotein 19-A-like isoform X1 [Daphnia pulex]|uniref:cAMP-regulated phosphoprotein 19-A-like isoform X1 n=1 Tax=Daphnia pulex TaxID=6669 RepID=UPI001EE0D1F3|nr:cAMP-regulated phosphoprotein 19-A-like isoform X1 [Daphnia pulex]
MLHCCYADDNSRQGVISANGAPYIPKENQITQFKEETKTMATLIDIEKLEEEKLKARYNAYPVTGHSAFLQKRLAKGQKYFDSGDYQMAKQKGSAKILSAAATAIIPPANLGHPTGDAIPTPESVPTRKTSIIQSKLASPAM